MHHSKKVVVRGCPNNLEKYFLRYLAKKEEVVTQEKKKKCAKEFIWFREGKYQGMERNKNKRMTSFSYLLVFLAIMCQHSTILGFLNKIFLIFFTNDFHYKNFFFLDFCYFPC